MAAVVTIEKEIPIGASERLYLGVIALDNSYPTGGEAIDVAGNTSFRKLFAQPTAGYVFEWDEDGQKLKAFRQRDPGAIGGADVPLPEVTNLADLSALTEIDFIAFGD